MEKPLYKRIAREANEYEFYAHYIRGRLEYYLMPYNMKQRIADLAMLEVLKLRQQGGTPQCLL